MARSLIVVSCLLLVVSLVGCAKTVTNVNFGSTLTVTVTLRGSADVTNNRYFLVLSSSPTFKVPLPPPNNYVGGITYEFLEPDGTLPKDGITSLEAYYTNYFSTWSGYVVLKSGGYFITPGPFSQGVAISQPLLSLYTPGSNKLSFNFSLSQLFASGVPATAYFDLVAVPWPAAGYKYAADHLESTNAYVSTLSGSLQTVTDPADTSVDPACDILTCEVTVQ
ncbi:MAG: hypothetical protein JW873_02350 [Candidatus Saganbacteria bacterium]|nr:hypothetical protein [Candidatus Saganbacteria bacterium]